MLRISAALALSIPLIGCSAIEPQSGAGTIVVSRQPAEPHCRLLGEVIGNQGNFVTAVFTSDRALMEGARNDLRNKAAALGANYVVIESENYSETSEDSIGGTHAAVLVGNAYHCQERPLLGSS
ncbi:MAG: DUF4156 domain-containing protein [Pseudomonadota bacterium]